ncbi:hypothetical protein QBC40DRAFT_303409 [Triangularia verruculosa]|uniref:RBR-type E3 ubiquitin transferase n=1 Tax=Triangularia verruculosa TaxID=2587418 RepID=A0AAN6XVL3_9PEZI|nr:hypothetical protein QBC40DRAFT_303409 [Triangularia verruculosa]
MELSDLDPPTLRLVVQMHLDDINALTKTASQKGKGRAGEKPDSVIAFEEYQNNLLRTSQLLSDEVLSRSIARAVKEDADALRALQAEEQRAASDRELALRLSGVRDPSSSTTSRPETPALDEEALRKLEALWISPENAASTWHAESSTWASSRKQKVLGESKKDKMCVACNDLYYSFDIVSSKGCGHDYCRECIQSLFQSSIMDETLFPPRCCGNQLLLDTCRRLLPSALVGQFRAKKIELETPNRTYCHIPTCSTFIPPQAINGNVAACVRCGATTCAVCKKAAHANSDCPEDPSTQELIRLAEEEGWQRCYSCARFVELDRGCHHITCRCGAQFCYVCGERWKTCLCPQWEENRLLARANAIVDREARAAQLPDWQRANLVEQERQNQVINHVCRHDSWSSRQGRNRCDECHDTLTVFIYECRQCRILACRRCRFNRL